MSNTHHIHHLAVAFALAFALLAGPAAAAPTAVTDHAATAIAVPPSEHNARWPREPASGPQPTVVAPEAPTDGRDWTTLVSVAAGILALAACTAVATGVRPRIRRRVAA